MQDSPTTHLHFSLPTLVTGRIPAVHDTACRQVLQLNWTSGLCLLSMSEGEVVSHALLLLQLANARSEQERLEAEARRARDAAHNQQLELMRQTISASKVSVSSP